MEKGEAYFIEHCDLDCCDLGTFQYICPECGRCVVDYEIWWEEDRIWKGKKVKFKCLLCGEKLVVEWNGEEFKVVKQS